MRWWWLLVPALIWGGDSFEQALHKARKEGKILLVQLTSKGCHYCQMMEEVLADPKIEEMLERHFLLLPLDVAANPPFQWKMVPTFLFFDGNGTLLKRIPGAWSREDFWTILQGVVHE
ncbi:MAG: hypothetical protein C6I00_05485 [Nitratiruptor sp.]|nr:hypothetical protein [Nitratiruptor sp.]NPA83552.1 thioredoxin family protein [Campylobacterota bacterium]